MTSRYSTPEQLVSTPRVAGLAAHRDGPVLVLRQELVGDGKRYVKHAWAVPRDGEPVRLTHDERGVQEVCPAPDGSVWFTSERPAPGDDAARARLWLLPERGEPRLVLDAPEGISGLRLAGDRLFFVSGLFPAAQGAQDEFARNREIHDLRESSGVSAVLHDHSPVRYWDHDLPAAEDALWCLDTAAVTTPTPDDDAAAVRAVRRVPLPAGRLTDWSVAPDGTWVLAQTGTLLPTGVQRAQLWRVPVLAQNGLAQDEMPCASDISSGAGADGIAERASGVSADRHPHAEGSVLLHDTSEDESWGCGEVSPDGSRALLTRERLWRDGVNMALSLWVHDSTTGEETEVLPADEHWGQDGRWIDDDSFVCTADHRGRGVVLRVHCPRGGDVRVEVVAGGADQDETYSSVRVAGDEFVGLRASYAHPSELVRWPVAGKDAGDTEPTVVAGLVPQDAVPGRLEEVTATAEDGTEIRAWLALPAAPDEGSGAGQPGDDAAPHPLLVFVHGGPWGSNNQWSWRWNPWPFVARGYAVLFPDPAISTGYGQSMIERGQQELGGSPFTDVMALVATTTERADVDPERQALLGGSYGGYMANWVATQTGDRFRCIVTHASLWNLDSMGATTDNTVWREALGPAQAAVYSPHRFVERIEVPLLVVHGDKDYRVPVSQGLELWADLQLHTTVAGHRFLYYPDEGHWILKPANARTWYETVLAFLDEHVLDAPWRRPELLG